METGLRFERSTDGGRTWVVTPVSPRSPLAAAIRATDSDHGTHDDGCGNLYRWAPAEETR